MNLALDTSSNTLLMLYNLEYHLYPHEPNLIIIRFLHTHLNFSTPAQAFEKSPVLCCFLRGIEVKQENQIRLLFDGGGAGERAH